MARSVEAQRFIYIHIYNMAEARGRQLIAECVCAENFSVMHYILGATHTAAAQEAREDDVVEFNASFAARCCVERSEQH